MIFSLICTEKISSLRFLLGLYLSKSEEQIKIDSWSCFANLES